jgi:hypothetical protein
MTNESNHYNAAGASNDSFLHHSANSRGNRVKAMENPSRPLLKTYLNEQKFGFE